MSRENEQFKEIGSAALPPTFGNLNIESKRKEDASIVNQEDVEMDIGETTEK
jgi:hypothetical protein